MLFRSFLVMPGQYCNHPWAEAAAKKRIEKLQHNPTSYLEGLCCIQHELRPDFVCVTTADPPTAGQGPRSPLGQKREEAADRRRPGARHPPGRCSHGAAWQGRGAGGKGARSRRRTSSSMSSSSASAWSHIAASKPQRPSCATFRWLSMSRSIVLCLSGPFNFNRPSRHCTSGFRGASG